MDVPAFQDEFSDPAGYLYVLNNIPTEHLPAIKWAVLRDKARGLGSVDPARKNRRCDVGFCGQRNSARKKENLGLTKPRMLNHTKEEWSVDIFFAMSRIVEFLRDKFHLEIYCDEERNSWVAQDICDNNVVEALACSVLEPDPTGKYPDLLACHRDTKNSSSPEYNTWLVTLPPFGTHTP